MAAQQSPSHVTCSLIQFQSTPSVNGVKHSAQLKSCKSVTSAFSHYHQLEQALWACELLFRHSCTSQCRPDTVLVWYTCWTLLLWLGWGLVMMPILQSPWRVLLSRIKMMSPSLVFLLSTWLYLSLTLSLNGPCGTSGEALLGRRSFWQS